MKVLMKTLAVALTIIEAIYGMHIIALGLHEWAIRIDNNQTEMLGAFLFLATPLLLISFYLELKQ